MNLLWITGKNRANFTYLVANSNNVIKAFACKFRHMFGSLAAYINLIGGCDPDSQRMHLTRFTTRAENFYQLTARRAQNTCRSDRTEILQFRKTHYRF